MSTSLGKIMLHKLNGAADAKVVRKMYPKSYNGHNTLEAVVVCVSIPDRHQWHLPKWDRVKIHLLINDRKAIQGNVKLLSTGRVYQVMAIDKGLNGGCAKLVISSNGCNVQLYLDIPLTAKVNPTRDAMRAIMNSNAFKRQTTPDLAVAESLGNWLEENS